MFMHSSWNSDRVAACCIAKPHKVSTGRRVKMYAQFKNEELKVLTYRGTEKFHMVYNAPIASAVVRDDGLEVELSNGDHYEYDYACGKFELYQCSVAARATHVGDIVATAA